MLKSLKFIMIALISFFTVIYLLIVTLLYFNQEKLIFPATKLSKQYEFNYGSTFEELYIPVEEDVKLNGLLFKAENSKGLIFYLHGNGGCLDTWGDIAVTYTDLGYDIFILDYRGYGKSGGNIESENQFFEDVKKSYAELLKRYTEDNVIIMGYSIGTGSAAMLASLNNPKLLILKAPYYNLSNVIDGRVPFMPEFLRKYKFETHKFLENVNCPVYVFHGTKDKIIPYSNSEKLKEEFPDKIELTTLKGTDHLINGNIKAYREKLAEILD